MHFYETSSPGWPSSRRMPSQDGRPARAEELQHISQPGTSDFCSGENASPSEAVCASSVVGTLYSSVCFWVLALAFRQNPLLLLRIFLCSPVEPIRRLCGSATWRVKRCGRQTFGGDADLLQFPCGQYSGAIRWWRRCTWLRWWWRGACRRLKRWRRTQCRRWGRGRQQQRRWWPPLIGEMSQAGKCCRMALAR